SYERVMENYDPWKQSLLFYFTAPWQLVAFHAVFLFCCAAFMVGWRTSWVKWVVLIGHISYDYRNPTLTYGVDKILACLLFILCFAPVGRAMSLDRVRALRMVKAATYGTILIEIAYPFLIWQPRTRPLLLFGAFILHLMFALLMGLYYFSFVMMMGHMSFVRPEWLTRLGEAWKRKFGDMEMIY